jgi:predicted metal-dependent phosphoesterase TrpH
MKRRKAADHHTAGSGWRSGLQTAAGRRHARRQTVRKSSNMDTTYRIQFEKPDLNELTSHYTVADLHFHSCHSDGSDTVMAIANRARRLGIGLGITDHNAIAGAMAIDKIRDVLSIPGIEVTSKEGTHVLLYFYESKALAHFYRRHLEPYMGPDVMSSTALSMEAILQRARTYEALVIFPHPFCAGYTGILNPLFSKQEQQRLFDMADGIEVVNSGNLHRWNLRSALLGFNLDKSITGGSDGHALAHMGRAVSYAACARDRVALMDAIKNRQNKVIGKEIDLFRMVTANSAKLKSNFRNYPDLVEKNIRYSYKVINIKSKLLRDNVRRSLNGKIRRKHRQRGF